MTYQDKLKDPRWQKKRLEILERDEWTCQRCGDTKSTLHIHHKIYKRCDPWDYDDDTLITLCECCHDEETHDISLMCQRLTNAIKKNFLSSEILKLAFGFEDIKLLDSPRIVSGAISMAL